jgi:aryl-alcohol dehydrogenase-like predicted oxidoreductase
VVWDLPWRIPSCLPLKQSSLVMHSNNEGKKMNKEFLYSTLGRSALPVCRLGLSASYRPGKHTVFKAAEAGVNFFFGFGIDTQMTSAMREVVKKDRDRYVLATGAYNLIYGYPNLRRTLEKRLRQFGTEYIDLFLFLGVMKEKELPPRVVDELQRFREEGKVRSIGISTHDRKLAGRLAATGMLDALMIRYNAAHRGAEQDIFPFLKDNNTGIVGYTATRWTYLLRRPKGLPKDAAVPTAGQCYRFVLSNPEVNVCLTAPKSLKEFEENLASVQAGPLSGEEMLFMRKFGDAVHHTKKWFM